jgi:NAD(P)-dependent dehydrogenase (short-subunit alcohol dehydrogenase family)
LINSVCPGYCATDLNNNQGKKSVEQGVETYLVTALLPEDSKQTGLFWSEKAVAAQSDFKDFDLKNFPEIILD